MGNIDMSGVWFVAIVGLLTCFIGVGIGVGAALGLGFALWFHNWNLMLWPAGVGGVIGLGGFIYVFRHEFTFGRRI